MIMIPKQLHHMIRLKEFMTRYDAGESYEDCLISKDTDCFKWGRYFLWQLCTICGAAGR